MPLDVDDLITDMLPALHATSTADLVAWTNAELIRYFGAHLKRMAERFGVFAERDITSITLVIGQATYSLPSRHLSTLHVALSNRHLIAASRDILEKRDNTYTTTAATAAAPVARWYQDKHGFNILGLHPVPAANPLGEGLLPEVIFHRYPCDTQAGIETGPTIGDYLKVLVMGEAYRKESDLEMPEVAKSCEALAQLYEAQIQNLWGSAQ